MSDNEALAKVRARMAEWQAYITQADTGPLRRSSLECDSSSRLLDVAYKTLGDAQLSPATKRHSSAHSQTSSNPTLIQDPVPTSHLSNRDLEDAVPAELYLPSRILIPSEEHRDTSLQHSAETLPNEAGETQRLALQLAQSVAREQVIQVFALGTEAKPNQKPYGAHAHTDWRRQERHRRFANTLASWLFVLMFGILVSMIVYYFYS